ncbi:uncharacterized protein F5Z01DRAFT_241326 [Emericellopsis atlantica]|uniref:Uncharacterized protein n=1 Tax=Emericellopsis atlantica TaxID=2614577 RepID=A0A9P7ZI19_9HYPO|nr:uncharacterized protein F5Z01DRAFT_241326 [Emericellopsis atlantica]KAG9252311.1 hypothetical protein F5Z01DRAFT_241326 [Emericellopsis atlantica]
MSMRGLVLVCCAPPRLRCSAALRNCQVSFVSLALQRLIRSFHYTESPVLSARSLRPHHRPLGHLRLDGPDNMPLSSPAAGTPSGTASTPGGPPTVTPHAPRERSYQPQSQLPPLSAQPHPSFREFTSTSVMSCHFGPIQTGRASAVTPYRFQPSVTLLSHHPTSPATGGSPVTTHFPHFEVISHRQPCKSSRFT